jgi:NAD(P)-dependent dehydrogenase (short-subunit alcohol dehydrogenase family)
VLEELSDAEFRRSVETNFLGAVSMARAVLPAMRERRRGDIVNFSSVAAFAGLPGLSAYGAAKAALEAFSEALKAEVAPFGVRVMTVTPGAYRTGFRDGHAQPQTSLAAYDGTPGAQLRDYLASKEADQGGDPVKLAEALIGMLGEPVLPVRFVTGTQAVSHLDQKLREQQETLDRWKARSEAAG